MNLKNHNPEWCSQKKNNQCDCIVEVDDVDMTPGGIVTKYVIRYCPTHEQATALQAENAELREALEAIRYRLKDYYRKDGKYPDIGMTIAESCVFDIAIKALTRPQEARS